MRSSGAFSNAASKSPPLEAVMGGWHAEDSPSASWVGGGCRSGGGGFFVGECHAHHADDDVWVLAIRGEHDVATEQAIRRELRLLRQQGSRIVVDLSDATFVGSTTVGAIWEAYQEAGRARLVVVAPDGSAAHRLLHLAGFHEHLPLFQDQRSATNELNHRSRPDRQAHTS
jgi:anti-anti-sigma factor